MGHLNVTFCDYCKNIGDATNTLILDSDWLLCDRCYESIKMRLNEEAPFLKPQQSPKQTTNNSFYTELSLEKSEVKQLHQDGEFAIKSRAPAKQKAEYKCSHDHKTLTEDEKFVCIECDEVVL